MDKIPDAKITPNPFDRILFYSMLGVPLIIYTGVIFSYVENIPILDEYQIVFGIANDLKNLSFKQFIDTYLFTFEDSYNYYFNQIITLLEIGVLGKVNFVHFILLGNLGIILFYIRFVHSVVVKIDKYLVAFVGFLILQFCFWEASFYGLCAIRRFWTVVLVFWAMESYLNNKKNRSLILSGIAIFGTLSNGIAIIPIIFFFIWHQKDRKYLWFWVPFSILSIGIYVISFMFIGQGGNMDSPELLELIQFFLILVSNALIQNGHMANTVMGTAILILSAISFYFNYRKRAEQWNLLLMGVLMFAFISQVFIALFRVGGGMFGAYVSRYSIYSALEILVISITFFDWLQMKRILKLSIFGICSLLIFQYTYRHGIDRYYQFRKGNQNILIKYASRDIEFVESIVAGRYTYEQFREAIRNKHYVLPENYRSYYRQEEPATTK